MRKLFILSIGIISMLASMAQTVTADRVVARQGVYIQGHWIDSVYNDTTNMTYQRGVMTNDAIRRYVQGKVASIPVTYYVDTLWRSNDSIYVKKNGFIYNLGKFQRAGAYLNASDTTGKWIQNQFASAQIGSLWINGRGRFGGRLLLDSSIMLGNLATDPTSPANGLIYYNTGSNIFRSYQNSTWTNLITGAFTSGQVPYANSSSNLTSSSFFTYSQSSFPDLKLSGATVAAFRLYGNGQYSLSANSNNTFKLTYDNVTSTVFTYDPTKGEFQHNVGKFVFPTIAGQAGLTVMGWQNGANTSQGATLWDTVAKQPFIWDAASWKYIVLSPTSTYLTLTNSTSEPTGSNGMMYYNTASNKFRGYRNGNWLDILMNGDVGYVTGAIITVDKNAANATDVRTGLSKYNTFYPFKSIAAAAAVMSAGDVLEVAAGTYTNDSLIISSAQVNTVYMDGVTLTGNIKMQGKLFLTNTVLNSYVFFYALGSDIASGNIISGLDKGSSIINGRIECGSAAGANYLTIRHLGKISTPASGVTAGHSITGTSNLRVLIDGVSTIENLSTSNIIINGGNLTLKSIGTVSSEQTGSQAMFYAVVDLYDVNKVVYKGTYQIAGGFSSRLDYAENCLFTTSTGVALFGYDGNNGTASSTFHRCKFINTKAGGYAFNYLKAPNNATQLSSLYIYNCQFQLSNNAGANYIINEDNNELANVHFVNCISNQNISQIWTGTFTTLPAVNIQSGYVFDTNFIIQVTPLFN
jgi:hypothetical protein